MQTACLVTAELILHDIFQFFTEQILAGSETLLGKVWPMLNRRFDELGLDPIREVSRKFKTG